MECVKFNKDDHRRVRDRGDGGGRQGVVATGVRGLDRPLWKEG